ncbi:hypothetical protein BD310DRAFT_558913 [Dichomitus squalens]|uniref:Uncharacterized protein n=1 Tax=Dichomitus squalens TaxID=114155 RepID=A0A4Q9PSQ2_9APHY|nr:hypothetical protein BD310DRAFT_558913 [Dichomitus squalens]
MPIHSRTRTAKPRSPASIIVPIQQEPINHAYPPASAPRTTSSFPEVSATTPYYPSPARTHKGQMTTNCAPETRIA